MTESAGTAQGVDVALLFVARVQILISTMVRPYCHMAHVGLFWTILEVCWPVSSLSWTWAFVGPPKLFA